MISDLKIPEKYQPYLRIGTCSWKYDSWKGLVYDPEKSYAPYDYLTDYARYFNTVEIDQWFWSLFPQGAKLPDPQSVQAYVDSVPDDFLFTVKAPNSITLTHFYAKQPSCRVETWRGGLGLSLSVAGPFDCRCLNSPALLRFHVPLLKPDMRISRIRLSFRTLGLRIQHV